MRQSCGCFARTVCLGLFLILKIGVMSPANLDLLLKHSLIFKINYTNFISDFQCVTFCFIQDARISSCFVDQSWKRTTLCPLTFSSAPTQQPVFVFKQVEQVDSRRIWGLNLLHQPTILGRLVSLVSACWRNGAICRGLSWCIYMTENH